MIYDRDLKWISWAILVLLSFNLGGAIGNAFRHNWLNSVSFLIWFANIWIWRGIIRAQQRTRDAARLTDAVVLQVLRDSGRMDESGPVSGLR